MKFKKLPNRSVPFGRMLLFCCIMLSLLTAFSAAAAGKDICIEAPIETASNNYANMIFCLSEEVNVEADAIMEENYTEGTKVSASMLLDGNRVDLNLLYPCIAPQTLLEPAALKSLLEAHDPALMQANYSEELLAISGKPAIWGQLGSQIFAALQPANQTVAIIVMDIAIAEETKVDFLSNLSIAVNEGITPPNNCPDTTDTTVAPAEATSLATDNEVTPAETRQENLATGKEKMAADMEAAKAKLEAAREKMRGF